MARSRVPKLGAIAAVIARTIGLGVSTALLATLVYLSTNWHDEGKTFGLAITAAVVAILVDSAEIAALVDRTRTVPRAPPPLTACGDVIVIGLALPGLSLIAFSDYRREDPAEDRRRPWGDAQELAWLLIIGVCCWRTCLSIWCCVECCCRRKPKRPRGATIVREEQTAAAAPGESREAELRQADAVEK